MGPAVELQHVRKRFGSVVALDGARLTLEAGEIHAFVRPMSRVVDRALEVVHAFELRNVRGG